MSSMPNPPTPDLSHPSWCDPAYCELLKPRPLSEHRSRPIVIESGDMFVEKISVWLAQFAFEDPASAPLYIAMRLEEIAPNGELTEVSTHDVGLDQAAQLAGALAELAQRGDAR